MAVEITPALKVGRFLDEFPELEADLISLSPQFKRLENPVLRRTVAKLVTLRQAARTGGISVEHLVNSLREKAGQKRLTFDEASEDSKASRPSWLDEQRDIQVMDAMETINAGGAPIREVMEAVEELPHGAILKLITLGAPNRMNLRGSCDRSGYTPTP
jgi:hypothetical protein